MSGIIPERETYEGWIPQGLEDLWKKLNAEWEGCGFRVNRLPDDLCERFMCIQAEAFAEVKAAGRDPETG